MSRKEYSWFLKTDYAPSSTTQQQTQDNSVENFKRANKILALESEPVQIWDFSARTTFIWMNEWNRMPQDPRSKILGLLTRRQQVRMVAGGCTCGVRRWVQEQPAHGGGWFRRPQVRMVAGGCTCGVTRWVQEQTALVSNTMRGDGCRNRRPW
ncbi:uncharacterized protein [Triticum aestivum]|uniref:uncharacterized protein n=1 Tax=Triticum aestivum TaxID=4565 RepID=UPI001D02E0CF|nr:uncharacterized protein LOC123072585 [Triticum aestivum]XP_044352096.1 uncharacterized protein LOC123072585 [Triticum aestivum]XP_044352097.1 uncharacterized protein LOC123072585 [Triticum aestivum]XP_044352098.1 uncharacterized protein LOC123072585 [Triticum aestivum]XP_044352099.1 uncharacterized protein LOC123072585 [Triticum aestivum]